MPRKNPSSQNAVSIPVAVDTIKSAILQSQYMAASSTNKIQLALYFSERSIKYMRTFFEEWLPAEKESNSAIVIAELANLNEFSQFYGFDAISFTHHINILTGAKSREERLFYIERCARNSWTVEFLKSEIKSDAFRHQGQMSNNFSSTLNSPKSALQAISMFKDEYLLDFMNVEELGERDKSLVDERVVENGIIHNIKNFIMKFGKDFAFIGNQYHLEKFGENQYIDLLFYNRELNALVAFELKMGDFKPAYLGQLSSYLRILDDEVRKPHEEPSIGIVLCKNANKAFVEYVIQDYNHPMGVATYKLMQEKLQKVLPDENELKKLL